MSFDDIIVSLYNNKSFNETIGKLEPEYLRDDLKSEVISQLIIKRDLTIDLHNRGKLVNYANRTAVVMMQSGTSEFYKKYRASCGGVHLDDEPTRDSVREKVLSLIETDKFTWYERELIKLYLVHRSYRKIAKDTGIPYTSCGNTIRAAFVKIKQHVKQI